MHLIQPIVIGGTPQCVTTWRTNSVLTGDMTYNPDEAADSWRMDGGLGDSLGGTISFGTSCATTFTLTVGYDKDSALGVGYVKVTKNGVEVWRFDITLNRSTTDINPGTGLPYNPPVVNVFNFTSTNPCGDVWAIEGFMPTSESGDTWISLDIT